MNGTARLFRANIIEPGSNDLADGFDRDKVSNDGVNFSDLETWGGSARLRWDLGRVNLYSITGYETRSEEHTSGTPVTNAHLVCRLLLEKKKTTKHTKQTSTERNTNHAKTDIYIT